MKTSTVLPAKSDSGVMFCLQSYQDLESIDHLCINPIRTIFFITSRPGSKVARINYDSNICRTKIDGVHGKANKMNCFCYYKPPDKSAYWKIVFFISHPKHMLWVLKRTVSMRRFF